jgi:oxygen-independent coproporphyrinogen-3 oxidase
VQKAINRIQPYEQVAHVVDRLKAAGIQDINVDLMYGLPHQTVPDLLTTTEQVRQLRPSRIALFGYAHVPWMKAHQALIDEALLPSPAERRLQHDSVSTQLVNSGYQAIGMDHFARRGTTMADSHAAGTLRRNFQGYTTDPATTLLGFGASAIGMTPQGYVQNETDVRRWRSSIEDRMLPIVKGIATDADDHVRRALIERLMCDMTVDIDQTATQFGYSIKDFAEEVDSLHQLRRDGLIDFENGFVRIPPKNHVLVRIVASVFDRYLRNAATEAKHATAV